jgi:hypothetical protein
MMTYRILEVMLDTRVMKDTQSMVFALGELAVSVKTVNRSVPGFS